MATLAQPTGPTYRQSGEIFTENKTNKQKSTPLKIDLILENRFFRFSSNTGIHLKKFLFTSLIIILV